MSREVCSNTAIVSITAGPNHVEMITQGRRGALAEMNPAEARRIAAKLLAAADRAEAEIEV